MMTTLLDIRDALAAAKNLSAAIVMACDARSMPADQRAALCEASNILRERLEALVAALDKHHPRDEAALSLGGQMARQRAFALRPGGMFGGER